MRQWLSKLFYLLVLSAQLHATNLYVRKTGNDTTGDGSTGNPWLTIQKCVNSYSAGDTCIVGDGTYSETLAVTTTGTAGSPVILKAENKRLAIIDGGDTSNNGIIRIFDDVDYFTVQDFEIRSGLSGGISIGDSDGPNDHITIEGNWIHDIGNLCTDTSSGIVGIRSKLATSNLTINANLFSDIGRYATGESGCTNGNTNWQNHDHHIYTFGTNITITNNVFDTPDRGWGIQTPANSNLWTIANNTCHGANPNRDGCFVLDTYDGNATNISYIANLFDNPTTSMITVANPGSTPCAAVAGLVLKNNLSTEAKLITDEFGTEMGAGACPGFSVDDNQTSVADPGLVNEGSGDFHLESDSPAIDGGLAGYVTTDYDGDARIGLPDIGAFEFETPAAPSTTRGLTITGSITILQLTITPIVASDPAPLTIGQCQDIVPSIWNSAGYDQPFQVTAANTQVGDACRAWAPGPYTIRP